jgi:hypothetical protein
MKHYDNKYSYFFSGKKFQSSEVLLKAPFKVSKSSVSNVCVCVYSYDKRVSQLSYDLRMKLILCT